MMRRVLTLLVLVFLAGLLPAQEPRKSAPRGQMKVERPRPPEATGQLEKPATETPVGLEVAETLPRAIKARSIGPAIMGGRISDIAIDPADPHTFYVALATGGLLKTTNNGVTFDGVTDKQPAASMGAVAVAPSDSKVIWLGTGEANDRNSSGWGDGVYLSKDGGSTWNNAGLKDSKTIARILVHPREPNTAWVAAMGDLWSYSPGRGCFKTTDGGATWKAVLTAPAPYADRAGCGDIAIDSSDPNVLYAALYARRRTAWSFVYGPEATDGRDVGGIFKSTDGGATWRKLEQGLPRRTGRIGLAVFAKNPKILYAIVQSDEGGTSGIDEVRSRSGGVFRSDDAGETWRRVNQLNPRPFYFSQIRVDPENDQRVYVLGFALHVSEDGGQTFREDLFEKVHPDCHALAIDARRPARLLLGTDGGLYQSYEGGKNWEHIFNHAAGEFYRINYDMSQPYRICGGLQDNLNWVGPSRTRTKDGIVNHDWINIGGGDGFYCVFDPEQPDIVYTESQQGYIHRMDLRNGQVKDLRPEPTEGQSAFRFHWNAPLIGSRHAPGTLYLGGNRVFRLTAKGEKWEVISPDLSTRDAEKILAVGSGAENYAVVYALAESPRKAGMLWAGTDDGKLWVTEDDGRNWTDLSAGLPSPVRGQWISRIEPGGHDPNVAYLAVSAFRSGNYAPLAYRTADRGKTWQSIASNLPPDGPVKVIREDPKNPNVLYAGTEFQLYVSLNRGRTWIKFGELPTVAVDDILIHPREDDLIIATHGRSLFIVDDLRPIQQLTSEVAAKEAWLFPPRPALGIHMMPGFVDWNGKAVFRGANPPEGALISFYVKAYTGDEVKISIKNAAGHPVAKFTAPGVPGISRINWDLKPSKEMLTEYGGEGQKFVRAGEYTVELSFGEKVKQEQKLVVNIAEGVETR